MQPRPAAPPPLLPVLRMPQVVRQVLLLRPETLLAGLASSASSSSGTTPAPSLPSVDPSLPAQPPGPPRRTNAPVTASAAALRKLSVPVRFDSLQHYTDVFRSLLMEELAAAVRSSVEELVAGGGAGASGRGGMAGGGMVTASGTAGAPYCIRMRVCGMQRTDDLHTVQVAVTGGDVTQRDMCRPVGGACASAAPVGAALCTVTPRTCTHHRQVEWARHGLRCLRAARRVKCYYGH